jgi:hypothetical protein
MKELLKRVAGLKEKARLTEIFGKEANGKASASHIVHE